MRRLSSFPVLGLLRLGRSADVRCGLAVLLAAVALSGCGGGSPGTPQTYSLQATVSGLTSSGLVITSNGRDVTVGTGGASFTQSLDGSLPTGASFSVTVKSQPTGQTCSVAGGTGTISSANVGNVVVTCSNDAFVLGGSIAGLNSSGLVLANGADTVTVTSGATTFELPTPVAYSGGYEVTVKTQPSGMACVVSGGAGSMPAAAVATIAVSCSDQPFMLGGTITDSPGVTLANGNDTLSIPAVAGVSEFTMGQGVPYGSTYNLTVNNVPAGHTCSVANASGTMGAADVTAVAVTCATNSYSIGGSLAGLSPGDTLVLVNTNGDHTTVDPTKSSYTMSQPVAYGGTFAISVGTQPSGKHCTVTNASSPNVSAAVSNANVTCSAVTRTVGGTISGLGAATGLVLLNNGMDNTTISANAATFTMTTGVADGSHYAITVQTQPTAAAVTNATTAINCTLTGDSGAVSGSNVATVVITCHNTVSFVSVGGPYTWSVPTGVSSLAVVATGGGGGGGGSNGGSTGNNLPSTGGRAGVVNATLAVNAGDVLNLFVGGGGGGGASTPSAFGAGGGGGGSSNVNPGTANQIIAGGGGGGGGSTALQAGGDGNGSNGAGSYAGHGGNNGIGGAGGRFMSNVGATGGSGNGGAGAQGGSNGNGTIPGGAGGTGNGSGTGGVTDGQLMHYSSVGGSGGGGYGGGGGSARSNGGGGGGGSTGPTGSTVGVATAATGPGSAGPGGGVGAHPGTPGGNGAIVINY